MICGFTQVFQISVRCFLLLKLPDKIIAVTFIFFLDNQYHWKSLLFFLSLDIFVGCFTEEIQFLRDDKLGHFQYPSRRQHTPGRKLFSNILLKDSSLLVIFHGIHILSTGKCNIVPHLVKIQITPMSNFFSIFYQHQVSLVI